MHERLTDKAKVRRWPNGRCRGVQRVSYAHAAMVDAIIANPSVSQQELATRFRRSRGWISQILASAAFQARLAERAGQLVDPAIRVSVEEHFKVVVYRTLEILAEKLDRPSDEIPDNLALRVLELGARALASKPQSPVEVNVVDHLKALGANLTRLLHRAKAQAGQTVDVEPPPT